MCQANRISRSGKENGAFNTMRRWDGDKYKDLWSLQPDSLMEQGGSVGSCLYEEGFLLNWEWIFLVEVFSTSGGTIWKQERLFLRFIFFCFAHGSIFQRMGCVLGRKRGAGKVAGEKL